MKHRPNCAKMLCGKISDVMLSLVVFGPLYFCAEHALLNLKEDENNAN